MDPHNIKHGMYATDWNVRDPGDAGTLVLDNIGRSVCELVSAGAETRTVPAPAKSGLSLTLVHKTDGGDITITVLDSAAATTYTVTFNTAGQTLLLESALIGSTYKWRAIGGTLNNNPAATQGAALTAQLTTIVPADAEGTPDYATAAVINSNAYGFASAQEAITVLYVIANLQVRLAEVEARLESAGIVAAN